MKTDGYGVITLHGLWTWMTSLVLSAMKANTLCFQLSTQSAASRTDGRREWGWGDNHEFGPSL